jgi:K+-sensing histidine kinase KdpD
MRGQERRQAVRQAWEVIERQVENLVRLVDDLLDVSRISRGKINLKSRWKWPRLWRVPSKAAARSLSPASTT